VLSIAFKNCLGQSKFVTHGRIKRSG